MKKFFSILIFSLAFSFFNCANAQSGVWTWVHGDSASNSAGNFGVQGVAALTNQPPALYEPCEWLDNLHNLWIFGGFRNASSTYSDLWKYDVATNQWIWMKGPGVPNNTGNYGVQGVPNNTNNPPAKFCAATWTDVNGDLWMYGGYNTSGNHRDDLWKYSISTNQWTWVGGSATFLQSPVYGSQGIPNALNTPGARYETSATWVDGNNLWMFGGKLTSTFLTCNDLWKYDLATNQWTWMRGANTTQVVGTYGTMGVSDPGNNPSSRYAYSRWNDQQGNFWLFGGYGLCADSVVGNLNDLWKYSLATNEWTWVNGSDSINEIGNFGIKGSPSPTNYPPAKHEHRAAFIDSCGNFWMFGGYSYFLSSTSLFQNDLWKYNPGTNLWTWVSGDSSANQSSNYGSLNVPSPTNMPGARAGSVAWFNGDSTFFMFGGYWVNGSARAYNDLWRFDFDTSCHVIVLPPVTANFYLSDSVICKNECITFYDQSLNATSWQWIVTGPQTYISSLQNPVFCINTSGFYDVELIACNLNGCDTINVPLLIEAKDLPVVNLGNDTIICGGDSVMLDAGSGFDSYLWSTGETISSITVYNSGNYFVQVTLNGCANSDTIIVTTLSCIIPVANFTSSDTSFCGSSCISFFDLSQNIPTSWQWTFTGAQTLTSTNQNPVNICYNNPGSYAVQLIACNQTGCDTITIQDFIVSNVQPVVYLGNDTLICLVDSITLDAGAGFDSYLWSTNETTQSISISSAGNYFVNVILGNCSATDTVIISTQSCALPVSTFSSSDSSFCGSACIDFTDLSINNPTSWQWTFTGAQTLTSTDQNPVNICYNNPGSYDVQLISCNQFGCDTLTILNFIIANSQPVVSLGNDTVVCSGDSLMLDAGAGNTTYLWSTNETTQTITVNSTGNYYVDVLLGNCSSSDSIFVNVHSCLIPYIVFSSSDSDFCEKQCVDFTDLSQNNPTSWQWYFPGASPDTSTAQNPTGICYNALGSFDIKLVACNQYGCDSLTLTNFVNVFLNPVDSIYLSNDTLYSIPAYSYQWYQIPNGIIAGETNQYFVPSAFGSYYCIITDSIGCVATSNVIAITGINLTGSDIQFVIQPNPNNGNFEIQFSNNLHALKYQLNIIDAVGKIVYSSESLPNSSRQKLTLNLEQGIYFVELNLDEKIYSRKMILMK